MTRTQLVLTLLILTFTACRSWSPAGFWTDYDGDHIIENLNDQGPWGGTRVIHWKAGYDETYSVKNVIRFAEGNGWQLTGDTVFESSITKTWTYNEQPVFPLFWRGFEPLMEVNCSCYEDFPRIITGDILVLSFTTNYVSIDIETQEAILTNGYVILNDSRNEMTLYHQWGE